MVPVPFLGAVKASFWRGGTSKGVFLSLRDLPDWFQTALMSGKAPSETEFSRMQTFFSVIMGSPDPYGRQLNGMGGGISSLSKAMVVGPPTRSGADLDYTFFQVGIKDGKLDMAGNCGNLSSAVGPFALNAAIYKYGASGDETKQPTTTSLQKGQDRIITMKMRNTNTNKVIESSFPACLIDGNWQYQQRGTTSIDGVPSTSSTITLSFLDPEGSKTQRALPTGNPIDLLEIDDFSIEASLIDVSNPGIFIRGQDVRWKLGATPDELNADRSLMEKLEKIRRKGTERMGLDPNISSIPKIVLLFPTTKEGIDISSQALSMEQAHKAVPVTLALNLGVACKMTGTIPHQLSQHLTPSNTVIGHPSGTLEVGADLHGSHIRSAQLIRTSRCLMEGYVNASGAEDQD
ncbi:hypothetical protein B0A52_02929 [Exophiala mesophila]|uniref:DUF453-domain-containing protein n=1 Tax=Exophiala mesophila TaxID=212818 RepID=A0A438NBX7_EXOME|nr:hypothetical protein B0A52_02929 [Exophiala mesophila]